MLLLSETDKKILEQYSPIPNGKAFSEKSVFHYSVATKDVSVIVPCYNSQEYLNECLKSILQQKTNFDFEVIAVNDGSTDDTGSILDAFAKKYNRLRVITQVNKGFSGARNTGISESRGKYLIFVDSDDYISEGYIDGLMEAAISKETDITACCYYSFYNNKKYKVVRPKNEQDSSLLNGCFWAKTFKRELFSNIMLPEGYWYEDSILAHLIYPKVTKYSSVDTCEYAYRKNPNGITETSKRQKKALDTFYITDLMLDSVRQLLGMEYYRSNAYYEILIEQFYLNQRRLLGLPLLIQKCVFFNQALFINNSYSGKTTNNSDRKLFEDSLRQNNFFKCVLAVKLDKLYKVGKIVSYFERK